MFHHFHGRSHNDDYAGSFSSSDFERIILNIGLKNIYGPLEWTELFMRGELEESKYCLTFDDGLRSQVDVALPILRNYGLKAFWFVCSSPYSQEFPRLDLYRRFMYQYFDRVEDFYEMFFHKVPCSHESFDASYKNWSSKMLETFPFYSEWDVKFRYVRDRLLSKHSYEVIVDSIIDEFGLTLQELAEGLWINERDLKSLQEEGHVLGMHSHDHPTNFAELDVAEQAEQYRRNLAFLSTISQGVFSMSHPCGAYTAATIDLLESFGITIGFRSNSGDLGYLDSKRFDLQLPRLDAASFLRSLGNGGSEEAPSSGFRP